MKSVLETAAGRRATLFLALLLIVWLLAGLMFSSALAGFFAGLIAAVFGTGAATLRVRRDGSWTLVRHK